MNHTVLFLDFDGVLHPAGNRGRAFMCRPLLEALLREPRMRHVGVVISSAWRAVYPVEALRHLFSPDLRLRIIACTPLFPEEEFARFYEISAWLAANPQVTRWIALDDDADGFPPDARRRLVLTDAATGLDERSAAALRAALAARSPQATPQFARLD